MNLHLFKTTSYISFSGNWYHYFLHILWKYSKKNEAFAKNCITMILRLWLLIHMGQKISVHGSQSENISGRLHIVYIKRHTRCSTYALPKCSICAQWLSYGCWGRYNFLIYLLSCLLEFYYTEDFCNLRLIF